MRLTGFDASYYAATANPHACYRPLEGEVSADIGVIGGGYTGLSASLHLAQRGYRVILLEAGRVGEGASGRNGGQVCPGLNLSQSTLEQKLGREQARGLWALSLEALQLVKALIHEYHMQCDLKPGVLHTACKTTQVAAMQREAEKLQQDYGYGALRFVPVDEIREMLGTRCYQAGQLFGDAVHLHPLNYALGLAAAAVRQGVRIHEQSPVLRYRQRPETLIVTPSGRLRVDAIVLACNGYLDKLERRIAAKIMPINNFMLATEPLGEARARELIRDDVAVADSKFVVNYFRLSADRRLLFGGGESYRRRFPADIKQFVRRHMLEIYPQLKDVHIDYGWGGTLAITRHRLPYFARLEPNLVVAQGYSGHGIALATLGGKLIAEAIDGKPERFDRLASLPSPSFPGGPLLRWPTLVAGMLYYTLRDRF